MNSIGIVYLVGAGPGDPSLLTLRAKDLIENCDVLVYDNLTNPSIRRMASSGCERIDVGKSPGRHTMEQEVICRILVEKAREGKSIVRLKGGDPFVFGRCAEEMSALFKEDIKYEIVPGVTAALACAAYSGIPLSHRDYGSSISFLTGHEDISKEEMRVDFGEFASVGGTLCIYMGMGKLEDIVSKLLDGGMPKDKPAAIVSWGTLPRQKKVIATLGSLVTQAHASKLTAPAIIFIGNAVGLAEDSNWFDQRPLFGRRFAITRSIGQSGSLKRELEQLGAEVLDLPLIKILPSEDRATITEVFAGIASYEWIVFTSINGVTEFMEIFFKAFSDIRSFGPMRIACVGESTASLFEKYGLEVELIPKVSTAENLAKELIATESLDSANVLVITGNRNNDVLVSMLETLGHAIVDSLQVYETDFADVVDAPDFEIYKSMGADGIIFTSSSTALSYVEQEEDLILGDGATQPMLCSFGPNVTKTLHENDLVVDLEIAQPSVRNMIDALVEKFGSSK